MPDGEVQVISTTADARAGTVIWPPVDLHRFVGFDQTVRGLAVDEQYVYWMLHDAVYQAGKDASATERRLLVCPSCQSGELVVEGEWVYLLDGASVVKVHRESLDVVRITTPWNHALRGSLLVDDGVVYTAAPGCVAISRTAEDGAQDEVVIEGAAAPETAGATVLARDGGRLVCASPTAIYALDEWGNVPRVLRSGVRTLWGLVAHDDISYWMEEHESSWPLLGAVETSGGEASLIRPNRDVAETSGHFGGLHYIAGVDRIAYATASGVVGLNPKTKRLDAFLAVGSASGYMSADDTHVYAAVAGRRPRSGDTVAAPAAWIARATIADFEFRPLDVEPSTVIDPPTPNCPTTGATVLLPAGTFEMGLGGSPQELPTRVTLDAFEMDRTEVTVRQYAACVAAGECKSVTGGSCNLGRDGLDCHPMNCVNRLQAATYCTWAGKQLPSAEEWEYAARGETNRTYPWGAAAPSDDLLCWSGTTRRDGTCAAGTMVGGANEFGLLDMSGNVREWVDGSHCSTYGGGACAGPGCVEQAASGCSESGASTYGGGWVSDEPNEVMSMSRVLGFVDRDASLHPDLGFRCLRRLAQ